MVIKNNLGLVVVENGIDWRAYFYAFLERHGESVYYEDRLLFADGWTYSATDYRGPEWPPPGDHVELIKLKRIYWTRRRQDMLERIVLHNQRLHQLRRLSEARSIPLTFAGGVSNPVAESEAWIALYRKTISECDAMLKELD